MRSSRVPRGLAAGLAGAALLLVGRPAPVAAWKIDPALLAACPILGVAREMAKAIVNSSEGVDCFVNGPLDTGTDPANFDDDDEGPEIKVMDLTAEGAYGIYFGQGGGPRDCIFVDEQLKIDAEAGDAAALEVLAATIVHETTHWVDHTLDGVDTPDEEGCAMEVWIFGFSKQIENVGGNVSCAPTPPGTLVLEIALAKDFYLPGEPIDVTLLLTNLGSRPVTVLDFFGLGQFLSFEVLSPAGDRLPLLAPELKVRVNPGMLADLAPGQQLVRVVRLNAPEEGFMLGQPGSYTLRATYHLPNLGCPLFGRDLFRGTVASNAVRLTVAPVIPTLSPPGVAAAVLSLLAAGIAFLRWRA